MSIRLLPGHGEERRIAGVVVEADEAAVTVEPEGGSGSRIRLPYADIERARTTFAWGGQPKPGKGPRAVRTPVSNAAEETA